MHFVVKLCVVTKKRPTSSSNNVNGKKAYDTACMMWTPVTFLLYHSSSFLSCLLVGEFLLVNVTVHVVKFVKLGERRWKNSDSDIVSVGTFSFLMFYYQTDALSLVTELTSLTER